MSTQPIDREELFHLAAEISDSDERRVFLQEKCQGNQQLIVEIEELLRHDGVLGSFLSDPVMQIDADATQQYESIVEKPGQTISAYKLREQIGEGGFGLVFVAEQTEPVRRKVALKIIRPGMDTKEVLARFQAEQQALALMDHPNIARVFDAGMTETGRPYFVMELVKGVPIAEYCNQQKLSIEERLELFVTVCQAVQHAHTKGIIHRDLKPSNIMIAPHDGVPVVKVIDFGVAKAIGQQLTNQTIYTSYSQMIGTPLYMSPEQAEINALDVDIRSDVYSLGVLLYELLTGTTPFDRERFSTVGYDEIRRIIKEEDPPRPSTRLTTLGELLTTVSAERHTVPGKLSALVKGDLDWIVMKALEKDRKRRYQTANELAEDVQRYLQHELVEARPPSTAYRLRKFIRRNRTAAIVATTTFMALTMTTMGTSIGMVKASRSATREKKAADDLRETKGELEAALSVSNEQKTALENRETSQLLQQAQLLISDRQTGYQQKVFEIIRLVEGRELSSGERERLRSLAVACLGDPAALPPFDVIGGFERNVHEFDVSPEGRWLAVSFDSKNDEAPSMLYDVENRKRVFLGSGAGDARNIRFVNDRLLVASIRGDEGQFRFWKFDDQGGWSPLPETREAGNDISDIAVSQDGRQMVITVNEYGAGVSLWDISDHTHPTENEPLRLPEDDPKSADYRVVNPAVHPKGQYVTAAIVRSLENETDVVVGLWEVKTGKLLGFKRGYYTQFSADGRWLAISLVTNGIEIYDAQNMDDFSNLTPTTYRRGDVVGRPLVLGDSRTVIYPSTQQGVLKVWDISQNVDVDKLHHKFGVRGAGGTSDGRVIVSLSTDRIKVWRLTHLPERMQLAGHNRGTQSLDYSPDGTVLATCGKDSRVRLWDTATGRLLATLKGGAQSFDGGCGQSIDISSDGRRIVSGGHRDSWITIWEQQDDSWQIVASFDAKLGRKTWCVRFCDNDRRLAVSGKAGVKLYKLDPDVPLDNIDFETDEAAIQLSEAEVTHFVSDESQLVWMATDQNSGNNRKPKLAYSFDFNSGSGPVPLKFAPARPMLFGFAIHPEGGLVYPQAEDGRIHQVGFQGQPLGEAFGHDCSHLKLHPANPLVATNGGSRSFEIWNRETGKLLMNFPHRGSTVWFLAWHPTRKQLAVARSGGTVELWNLDEVEAELEKLGL